MVATAVQPQQSQAASVIPMPGERERDFVYRAHYALMASVPDPAQRNEVVWAAWDNHRGNLQRQRATNYFPPEQYRHVPGVCYFYEHSTMGRDGSEHKYSFQELADIADNQNKRANTDCYSAIASHHTSDLLKGPGREPWTVGYAGVYRLGMLDPSEPKWGIFADEFHRKDQSKLFNDRRRRSVEVLRFRDGRTPILDPIATLGVDSPRLNLPVARYEAEELHGIERYSFMTPASVGANSSYVPTIDKSKYEFGGQQQPAPETQPQGSAMGGSLSPADVQQIVDAVRSVPELAWCRQQMQAAQTANASELSVQTDSPTMPQQPPTMPPQQSPSQQYGMGAPSMPPSVPATPPTNQPGPVSPLMPPKQMYSIGDDEEMDKERYEALEAENSQLRERYERLSDANKLAMQQLKNQHDAIANLERRACDADRIAVIDELCEQYSHLGADKQKLLDKCLYRNGSELDNEEFLVFIEGRREVYSELESRSPTFTNMIPNGATPEEISETERYQAVMDRHAQYLEEDRGCDFVEIEEKLVAAGKLSPRR